MELSAKERSVQLREEGNILYKNGKLNQGKLLSHDLILIQLAGANMSL
jgi:hypothetical protein